MNAMPHPTGQHGRRMLATLTGTTALLATGTGLVATPAPAMASTEGNIQTCARAGESAGFGNHTAMAISIGMAESSCSRTAKLTNKDSYRSIDRGLWQINNHYHSEIDDNCAYDIDCNASAALSISNKGTNWIPWSTYKDGTYKKFTQASRVAAAQIVGHNYRPVNHTGSDILAEDSTGTGYFLHLNQSSAFDDRLNLGTGWSYRTLASVGRLGDDEMPSVLAQTNTGEGYLLRFSGTGAFAGRQDLGVGWSYRSLTPLGDVNSDGSSDVLGVTTSGEAFVLHFSATGTLTSRDSLGTGWTYTAFAGLGAIGSDGTTGLLAVDSKGEGWLQRFDASGRWLGRTLLGSGYTYTTLVGVGDVNDDGLPDVLGVADGTASILHFDANGDFVSRTVLGAGWSGYATRMTS